MNTPAAKRRRVDAANATLRKPFHSPLLRRQPDAGDKSTPGSSKTLESNSNKRSFEEAYSPSSPSVARQPQGARPAQAAINPRGSSPRQRPSSPKPPSSPAARDDPGDDENPFLALARAYRTRAAAAGRDAIMKDLNRRLDLVRQAGEIEAASERSRPGEPVDQELRDLVVKWRAASRLAAEELFDTVKERVDK
jgi:Swi5-dependent recombination DNA repair protein 1